MLSRQTAGFAPYALTVLRVVAGIIFIAHGYPKIAGLAGFAGGLGRMGVPLPDVVAVLVVVAEVVGGAALILGIAARWFALVLAIEMVVTTFVIKMPNVGLVAPMERGTGAEIDLILLAAMLVVLTAGAGALALDRAVLRREI